MWLNRKVKKAIKKRNKKWKLYCNTRNDTNYTKYKKMQEFSSKGAKKKREKLLNLNWQQMLKKSEVFLQVCTFADKIKGQSWSTKRFSR